MKKILFTSVCTVCLVGISAVTHGALYERGKDVPKGACLEMRCASGICMEDENLDAHCCPVDSEKPKVGDECNECGCSGGGKCILPVGKLTGGICVSDESCDGTMLYPDSKTQEGGQCCKKNEKLVTGKTNLENALFTGYKSGKTTKYGCCAEEKTYKTTCCGSEEKVLLTGCCATDKIYSEKNSKGEMIEKCCTGSNKICGEGCCTEERCTESKTCCPAGQAACGDNCCTSDQSCDATTKTCTCSVVTYPIDYKVVTYVWTKYTDEWTVPSCANVTQYRLDIEPIRITPSAKITIYINGNKGNEVAHGNYSYTYDTNYSQTVSPGDRIKFQVLTSAWTHEFKATMTLTPQ